jgi:hypothetical protein
MNRPASVSETSLVPYSLQGGEATGGVVAGVAVGDTLYSVMVPPQLDREKILADHRRSSRSTDIETLAHGPYSRMALLNRTVLLVAFDEFDRGGLPKEAWAKFRVGATLLHSQLRQAHHSGVLTPELTALANHPSLPAIRSAE